MNRLGALHEQNWEAKPGTAVDGPYRRGANLRVEAAARLLIGGRRLLDLGCGAGLLSEVVGARYGEVHGVDLSARAVAAAAKRGVVARVWDLNETSLPYGNEDFDGVVAIGVLPYVFDPLTFVREAVRVLRPGGQICLGCSNMRAFWRLLRLAFGGRFPRVTNDPGYDGGTIHYFCRRDVEALLIEAGVRIEASVGAFTRPRWLEGRADRVPMLSNIKREFLSGEVLAVARKPLE